MSEASKTSLNSGAAGAVTPSASPDRAQAFQSRVSAPVVVYAVTGYDVGGNSGYVTCALFTTREAAEKYVAQDTVGQCAFSSGFTPLDIEELELRSEAPTPYAYWHRGAAVYPDGSVEDWCVEHSSQEQWLDDRDDLEPWDGHFQGHCGLHISLFGADRDSLEAKYQRQLKDALAQMGSGKCQCGREVVYQSGFWGETRVASNRETDQA